HLFELRSGGVVNLREAPLRSRHPFLQVLPDALIVVTSASVEEDGRIGSTFFDLPPPPVHDGCATAKSVTTFPYDDVTRIDDATTGVPDRFSTCALPTTCNDGRGSKSVWYGMTAASDGVVTIDTTGSAFPTLVTVYGGGCATRTEHACGNAATPFAPDPYR